MTNIIETVTNTIKNWWVPVLVGAIFILVGVTTFAQPNESFLGLALVFSISFIIIGVMEIFFSFSNREVIEGWGWLLALGILTLLVGIMLTQNQEVAQTTLPIYISFLLLFRSIMGISTSLDLKSYGILDWGTVMLISVLAMILSFIMLFNPQLAAVSIVFWTGAVFLLIGIASVIFGFRLRKIKRTPQRLKRKATNAVNNAKEEVSDAVSNARDKVSGAIDNAKKNINDAGENLRNQAGDS